MNKSKYPLHISINSLNTAVFAVFFILLPIIFLNQIFETASVARHILISGVACLLLLTLSIRFVTERPELKLSYLHISFLVFLCWALLSIVWSSDVKNSITELTQLFFYFTIAFLASQLESKQIKTIFIAIYIGASIAAVIGILQAFNLNPLDLKLTTPLASTFNNKNHASVFFDLVIPLALLSMLTTKSYEKHIASIAYTLVMTFILLARTKGSILGFFIFTIFFIIFIYKNKSLKSDLFNKKNIIKYTVLTFIIPVSIYTLTTFDFIDTHTPKEWNTDLTKSSTSIRLSWYKNAYAMLKENPLTGVGYGAFRQGFAPYASSPNIVKSLTEDQAVAQLHNDPYQIFMELGLVGGGLILFIFSYIVFKGSFLLSTIDIKNKGSPHYLFLGCFLALVSSITHSFVDFPMRLPSSAVLFWFLTGLIIPFISHSNFKISFTNKSLKIAMGVSIFLLSSILLIHSYSIYSRYLSASKLAYQATASIQKDKNCIKARDEIDQAINLFFEDAFIRQRYVQIYSLCKLSPEIKLAAMNSVLSYDLTNARARLTRANLLLDKKDFKSAQLDFNYLTYVLPHRPAAYLGLGDIASLNKNFKNARKYYEKAKSLDPQNQKAHFMLKQFDEKGI